MKHRVVITGVGIVSSLGVGADTVAAALRQGKSGIVVDRLRAEKGFLSPLTGRVPAYTPCFPLSRKQKKTLPEYGEWAVEAAFQAIADSGLELADWQNPDSGLVFSNDSSSLAPLEQTAALAEHGSTTGIGSGQIFRCMTSCITINLNVLLRTQGAAWTIGAACAGGGHAVGQAADLIRLGRQTRVLCGGAQEINFQSMCGFDGLGAFSRRVEAPEQACRPFDAGRDGLVPSGGAAALVLEDRDTALTRGAKIWGEVAGYGFSSDGHSLSMPGNHGLRRAMEKALADASFAAADVDYICAHATSTPGGDAAEAKDIADLFGRGPAVSSTKSMTGHELWMSGAAQLVYSCLMAGHGFMAPNRNFVNGDGITDLIRVIPETVPEPPRKVLCNAAGFGGTNACLALDFTDGRRP